MALPKVSGLFKVSFDPELKYLPTGTAVLSVPISAGSKRKNSDEWDNFDGRLTLFGDKAEQYAEAVQKGAYITVVNAEAKVSSFTKQDGTPKTIVELNGTFADMGIAPPRQPQGQQGQQQGGDPFGGQQGQPQGQFQGQQMGQFQNAPQQNYPNQQQSPYGQPQQGQGPYGQQQGQPYGGQQGNPGQAQQQGQQSNFNSPGQSPF